MTPSSADSFVIGVDIGGTKVAAGLVDRSGEIRLQERVPMVPDGEASAGLRAVTSVIDAVTRRVSLDPETHGSIRGIGICSPGPLDPLAGLVINPPNVPCWRNYPLASEVASIYRIPVKLDNDANAAALAEARWGAGQGYNNIFYATIGTGIGTGIVLDGKILHGRTGAAGEGGHVTIDYRGPRCGCGKRGCIEAYASGPAIARRTREKLTGEAGRGSALHELSSGNPLTCEMVGQAYAAGDRLAIQVLEETIELLSAWLGNIVDLLDPEVIIFGGGVAAMLQPFFPEIIRRLPLCSINSRVHELPLLMARYGPDAGIAGAAALCSDIEG